MEHEFLDQDFPHFFIPKSEEDRPALKAWRATLPTGEKISLDLLVLPNACAWPMCESEPKVTVTLVSEYIPQEYRLCYAHYIDVRHFVHQLLRYDFMIEREDEEDDQTTRRTDS